MKMNNNMNVHEFLLEKLNSTKRSNRGHFPSIKVGNFIVSIQGSIHSYSKPQKNFDKLFEYEKLEIAIFDSGKNWISPRTDERFKHFEWANLFEEGECPVAGYMTIEQIERVFKNLLLLFEQSIN